MLTRVQKWGNSLSLKIPKAFAEEPSVAEGSTIDLSVTNGELRVRPVRQRKYELSELLTEASEENLHDEVPTGEGQGRESR